jgi:hypothetical protein
VVPSGEVPTNANYVVFSDTNSTQNSGLGLISVNSAGVSFRGNAGTLDHDGGGGGVISDGFLAGNINSGQTVIAMSGANAQLSTAPAV